MISLFGIGYVGTVTAACSAKAERKFVCVDVKLSKVELINRGIAPVVEPFLDELIRTQVEAGNLRATTDVRDAVLDTSLSMICVGTPGDADGRLVTDAVLSVARDIACVLRQKGDFHVVTVRSTVLPGTVEKIAELIAAESGKVLGKDFGVASNPEFLREGTAIADYQSPPFTVIGASCSRTADAVAEVYMSVEAPLFQLKIREAELLKYVCNSFHAAKVAFANEIGALARAMGIDGRRVMEVFVQDTKLNISPAYLRPGPPFGGSCLPKDTRAISYEATTRGLHVPLLQSIEPSNHQHISRILERIRAYGSKKLGFLGLSFKAGTDDLRESPALVILADLLEEGYEIRVHDPDIKTDRLIGANQEFVKAKLPSLPALLEPSVEEVVRFADVLVVSKNLDEYASLRKGRRGGHQRILDLVGLDDATGWSSSKYEGIGW